jgi:hypothetical protein
MSHLRTLPLGESSHDLALSSSLFLSLLTLCSLPRVQVLGARKPTGTVLKKMKRPINRNWCFSPEESHVH